MRRAAVTLCVALESAWTFAFAQNRPPQNAAEQIELGAKVYARNCSPCHGARMLDPQGAFDLRTFPHDQHERFISSVTHGKNQMPPWGGLLKLEEVEAVWAYVVGAEGRSGQ